MAWFREALSGSVWLDNLEPLSDISNSIQRIRYYQSKEFGKVLVINDELQHVEAWAPFYHEIVVHLPCSLIDEPRNVLVLGGGSLFAAAELLKYKSITCIDLVDYDINIIEATSQVYSQAKVALGDERLNVITDECTRFLMNCTKSYDLVINDCFDLVSEDLKCNHDLYQIIFNRLSAKGICSDLIYRSIYCDGHTQRALRRISAYQHKAVSLLAVPEYPGFLHLLTIWGKNVNIHQQQRALINKQQAAMHDDGNFQIYSPKNLAFYFYIPPYLLDFFPK